MSVKRSSRVRNPQGQGSRLRAELIDAADRILAETGDLHGLSLRAVAREVGIATPSIYLHFPDKAALVRAVLEARFAELAEAVQTAVMEASGSAAQLRAGCLAYCRFATEHPNAYRVLFSRRPPTGEVPLTPQHPIPASPNLNLPTSSLPSPAHGGGAGGGGSPEAGREGPPGTEAFGLLVDGVAACMRAGVAPDGDPFRVATNLWTALHGIVSLRSATPGFPWPALERQVDDVLAGLAGLHHNSSASEG